jgi:ATP-dependent Lon protease
MQDPLNSSYPVLPLRDIVVFPHMIVPLLWAVINLSAPWKR